MKVLYEITIYDEINKPPIYTNTYKSVLQMSKDEKVGIPYHQLNLIFRRKNQKTDKYKNTPINVMTDKIKINAIVKQ